MIYYFSGTGNSLWVAKKLGEIFEQDIINIASVSDDVVECSDSLIGFVFPTYMMDIPWFVKQFLLKLKISGKSYCFAVSTSNNGKSGFSAKNIDSALQKNGAKLDAHFDFQMPGNCIESSQNSNEKRLAQAPERVNRIAEEIKKRTGNFHSTGKKAPDNFVSNSFFYGPKSVKRLTVVNTFDVTGKCTGCGICVKVCPLNNIKIDNGVAVHSCKCAACYACLHWCPEHATLPKFFVTRNRKQYRHPEIKLGELISSKK